MFTGAVIACTFALLAGCGGGGSELAAEETSPEIVAAGPSGGTSPVVVVDGGVALIPTGTSGAGAGTPPAAGATGNGSSAQAGGASSQGASGTPATAVPKGTAITLPFGQVYALTSSEQVYRAFYDQQFAANAGQRSAVLTNCRSDQSAYYLFHWIWPSMHMFIASGDPVYLDQALEAAEMSMACASVIDTSGFRNWGAPGIATYTGGSGVQTGYLLNEVQAAAGMAWAGLLARQNPWVGQARVQRGTALLAFVRQHVVDKWYRHRGLTGDLFTLDAGDSRGGKDRAALAGIALAALNADAPDATYQQWLSRIMTGYKSRLTTSLARGGKTPLPGSLWMDVSPDTVLMDTSHSNRWPALAVMAYIGQVPNAPLPAHIDGMGRHFASMIYNGDASRVEFSADQRGGAPFADSRYSPTYMGWHWLGLASPSAHGVTLSTVRDVTSGSAPAGNTVWISEAGFAASYMANQVLARD